MSGSLDRIHASLPPCAEMRRFFDACIRALMEAGAGAIAVGGSLARGTADAYSDVDLRAILPDDRPAESFREDLVEALSKVGRPLALYTGSHLSLERFYIFVLQVGDSVQKLDLALVPTGAAPGGACVVWDPDRLFADGADAAATAHAPGRDWQELQQKFCGWIWYTYTRVARAEYFGAVASLEYTRQHALLPCLLELGNQPQDGYRALETRLREDVLRDLARTYPAGTGRDEILRALASMIGVFEAAWKQLEQRLGLRAGGGTVADMVAAIPGLGPCLAE